MLAADAARAMTAPVAVFPCGNPDRGDDGAALAIGSDEALAGHAGVELYQPGDLGVEVLVDLPAETRVLIIDAVIGPAPGAIVTARLDDLGSLGRTASATSTHVIPLDRLLGLVAIMRGAPLEGLVVGIGAAQAWPGSGLSAPVAAALPDLAAAVRSAVEQLVSTHPPASASTDG